MKKEIFKFLVLLCVAIGAAPAYSAMWQWSTTSANNATADPNINWSEGQSPSSVNDSARAMMGQVARWRDDISGLLTTSGTASAYTVSTNEGLQTPTPVDGQMISVTVNATNASGATLAADGGTAYPIQSAPGAAVGAGVLVSGSPYTLRYSTTNSAWMLRDYYGNPFSVPLGAMIDYTGDTSPNTNFILPAGQCISRTTYASYFSLVGTRFGTCDGTTTFAAPDLRGRSTFALDNLNGSSANRVNSTFCANWTVIGSSCGLQSVGLTESNLPFLTKSLSGDAATISVSSIGSPGGFLRTDTGVIGVTGALNTGTTIFGGNNGAVGSQVFSQGSYTPSGTVSFGGNQPFSNMPPAFAVSKLLRIL